MGVNIMELKTWKQLPDDNFTCVEVPSYKMGEIIQLSGGRFMYSISSVDFVHWAYAIPDDKLDSIFTIIRDLRSKGMEFEENDV